MGSKLAKAKGRSTETKVKNRSGTKIVKPHSFNKSKALEVFESAKKNGFNYVSVNEVFDGINSIRKLRARIGYFMDNRHMEKLSNEKS